MAPTVSHIAEVDASKLDSLSPSQRSTAHSQWLNILSARLSALQSAHNMCMDLDAGGGMASVSEEIAPLEEAVNEARKMVSVLGSQLRRRGSDVDVY
ncbi:hypothetical protein L198_07991 [Cryptococcus wingfieldii CBS 7118]|uniref:Uncharacterized protein n=1 Tax=Cryptococcus wingfieldii CBS 7118 TaxID=1295528 RepID=A0A1E3HP24_9TREE|nr:hypothetical protein L198_07991 [Cryptococcus wingfieldii CBS 7118]ODN78072.1 hypothetical protein L198_07991 [Cryptococcus wingfieldii CBS 7118]